MLNTGIYKQNVKKFSAAMVVHLGVSDIQQTLTPVLSLPKKDKRDAVYLPSLSLNAQNFAIFSNLVG